MTVLSQIWSMTDLKLRSQQLMYNSEEMTHPFGNSFKLMDWPHFTIAVLTARCHWELNYYFQAVVYLSAELQLFFILFYLTY